MTRSEMRDTIPVLQAWVDGAKIQRQGPGGTWHDIPEGQGLTLGAYPIRIKPEPREWWVSGVWAFDNEAEANSYKAARSEKVQIIHVREVV